MRRLAKDVGVTAPALYRHFGSKEELLLAVVEQAYDVFSRYLYRALRGSSAEERFHLAGEAYLDFALENPRLYEALYTTPEALGMEGFPREIGELACAIGQFWHDRVREMIDAGFLRSADPEDLARTMWAHAHGLMSIYLRGMLPMEERAFRAFFTESSLTIVEGLGTPKIADHLAACRAANQTVLTA